MQNALIQELFQFANYLAEEAGQISLKYFRKKIAIDNKDNLSPVTVADREVELRIRELIKAHYPHHGIIGEEFASYNHGSDYCWVLDPIDGTVAFTTGKPTYTTLIGLLFKGIPLIGLIDQPYLKERFGGVSGTTFLNEEKIVVSATTEIGEARLNATTPYMFKTDYERSSFERVRKKVKLTSFGGDAYAFGLLAAGLIDIIMEADLGYYDIAALVPIVEAAGGVITDWQGNRLTHDFNGQCLASANQQLHTKVIDLINK